MRNNIIILLIIASGLLFQSCSNIIQDYKSTDPYELSSYRTELEQTDSSSMGNFSWREIYEEAYLVSYIEQGLENNLDVLKAQENLRISSAYARQAGALFYPTVGVNGNYRHSLPSRVTYNGENIPDGTNYGNYELNGMVSWEVDVWGKIRSQRDAAKARYLQSEQAERAVKSEIVASIALNYYNLLTLDAQKTVLLSTIENRVETIETMRALKEAGQLTEVAVVQNEALLYNSESLLIDVENSIKLSENALCVLLGISPQAIDRSSVSEVSYDEEIKTGYPVQLLRNRPDVLAAEYRLVEAYELSNIARTNFYPQLSISGGVGLSSENFENLFSASALFANILGNISQPILNQRRLKTEKEVRLSEQEIAYLDYKKNILNAYREVSDAINSYESNEEQLAVKSKELDALTKAIDYSELLLNQGLANYLEVIRANDSKLQTELQIIQLEQQKLANIVRLYKALGGGWK